MVSSLGTKRESKETEPKVCSPARAVLDKTKNEHKRMSSSLLEAIPEFMAVALSSGL
jgi:hypothetical protein